MQNNPSQSSLLLTHASLVLPHAVANNAHLLIEAGRIARIITNEQETAARGNRQVKILDLSGLTTYPGFIDVHIHGAAGHDTMEAPPDDLRETARFLATQGVTGWLPTLVPAPDEDYARAIAAISDRMRAQDEEILPAARTLGVHYEGPFINAAQCGALRPAYFLSYDNADVLSRLAQLDARLDTHRPVHMTTLAPEIAGGIELIHELRRRNWVVSIGHTRASIAELDAALAAGARHMTHFMNAMPPLHHRAPGPIGWGLANDGVTCDLIADGQHLDPLIIKAIMRCKTADRVALISDAVAPAGLPDGDYAIWGETITVRNGRTSNARGNIAGSVITMCDAARRMLALGCTPLEVSRMAATNPARLIGLDEVCGTIEVGKRADMVALDDDGRVRLTIIGGRVAFDSLS